MSLGIKAKTFSIKSKHSGAAEYAGMSPGGGSVLPEWQSSCTKGVAQYDRNQWLSMLRNQWLRLTGILTEFSNRTKTEADSAEEQPARDKFTRRNVVSRQMHSVASAFYISEGLFLKKTYAAYSSGVRFLSDSCGLTSL